MSAFYSFHFQHYWYGLGNLRCHGRFWPLGEKPLDMRKQGCACMHMNSAQCTKTDVHIYVLISTRYECLLGTLWSLEKRGISDKNALSPTKTSCIFLYLLIKHWYSLSLSFSVCLSLCRECFVCGLSCVKANLRWLWRRSKENTY